MTREIKFRAWDGTRMWFNVQETYDYIEAEQSDRECVPARDFADVLKRMNVMQFTGLHDKNGREIFEGDIMQFDVGESGIDPETFRWEVKVHNLGNIEPYNMVEGFVIGNIYETPELLTNTTTS